MGEYWAFCYVTVPRMDENWDRWDANGWGPKHLKTGNFKLVFQVIVKVKDLALSLLWLCSLPWLGFHPWPGDFCVPRTWSKKVTLFYP